MKTLRLFAHRPFVLWKSAAGTQEDGRVPGPIHNAQGVALILTLMVLSILTAMIVEFSYGIYINTSALYNWQTAQRLSLVASSGLKLASKMISEYATEYPYTYPGVVDETYQSPLEDSGEAISIRVEDENSKLNLNYVVFANGKLNEPAFLVLVRLLQILDLDPKMADRIVDWIDPDLEPRLPDSEKGSKNAKLDSVNEILLIPAIERSAYERLAPFITIYGSGQININGAQIPLLMSFSDAIDAGMAERIVGYRDNTPFEKPEDILKVAGFETIGQSLMGRITVKGTAFRVTSTAAAGDTKRIIETILDMPGGNPFVKYWVEF